MNQQEKSQDFIIKTFIDLFKDFSKESLNILFNDDEYRKHALLYHYTSLQSFQRIIENGSLRATSVYMLNDPNELVHGYESLLKLFNKSVSQKLSVNSRYKSYYGFPAFIFSLSELSDNMHLWEKYGDKHKGIRIGFTPEYLMEFWRTLGNDITVILAPVIYHERDNYFINQYSEHFKEFKNKFVKTINDYCTNHDLTPKEADDIAYCTSLIGTLIKRKEWSLEKEWRIICIPEGYVHNAIIGDFSGGFASAKLEHKTSDVLNLLINKKNHASKDILKVGSLSGDIEFISYTIQLLMKKQTGVNFFNDTISKSTIVTR